MVLAEVNVAKSLFKEAVKSFAEEALDSYYVLLNSGLTDFFLPPGLSQEVFRHSLAGLSLLPGG